MVAVNTMVEINHDGAWVPGVVIDVTDYRLVVAVNGDKSHRAYIARHVANWRTIPKSLQSLRTDRRRAVVRAHNVFARQ